MINNTLVYWIFRVLALLYSLCLGGIALGMLSHFEQQAVFVLIGLATVLGVLIYVMYIASCEAAVGTERGRRMSLFIALNLLLIFPLGTVLAMLIFAKSHKNVWQYAVKIQNSPLNSIK